MIKDALGPYVSATVWEGKPAFVVTRYRRTPEGKWITQALSNSGEWVQRPEGFDYDAEVILRNR